MTTKTPEALREKAQELAQQAAEVQAELDAQAAREWEREQAKQRKADQTFVDDFDAARLDREVDQARHALDEAVSAMPVTAALAGYLAAQYRRNWAHLDLQGALGRLGLPTNGGHVSGTTEIPLDELIVAVAQRDAQRQIDDQRGSEG